MTFSAGFAVSFAVLTGLLSIIIFFLWSLKKQQQPVDSNLAFEDLGKLQQEVLGLKTRIASLETERRLLEGQLSRQKEDQGKLEQLLNAERAEHKETYSSLQRNENQLKNERQQAQEKIALLSSAQETLKIEFQNLANKILEEKSEKFTQQNKNNIESLMNPLREQLKEFKIRVEETYDKESKERFSLQKHIMDLQGLNQKLSEDANNLTNALKGGSKTQGNWGELILERILEESGLQKGREYQTQESFSKKDNDEKQRSYQPDVLIYLPEGKVIIIDAKVSLTAYEKYCSGNDEGEKALALKEHLTSIRAHVNGLSNKKYQDIDKLKTLDFVLMFMPVESAFLLAMEKDQSLYREAIDKNVFIVSPSNLLVMLRTVNHTWRSEKQNQNAQIIAERAGKLFDKFVGLLEDLDEVGKRIDQAKKHWEDSMGKLRTGRGNLMGRVEELQKLGAKSSKPLPQHLLPDDSQDFVDDENLAEKE